MLFPFLGSWPFHTRSDLAKLRTTVGLETGFGIAKIRQDHHKYEIVNYQ